MPTYVYSCTDCGTHFESLRPMNDSDAPISCKNCNSSNTHRCLTTCNISSHSDGSSYSGNNSSGCAGCQGGTCASCGH